MSLDPIFEDGPRRDWQTLHPADVDPVRVAIVGLGQYARREAIPALEQADFCTPTVCVSCSTETATSVADEFDIDEVLSYRAFAAGQASGAYDAVYIATPTGTHLDHARTATDLGKHVVCEKPIETSVDRAQDLIDACADADVVLMVAYRIQLDPTFRRIRELLDDGLIGEVRHVSGSLSVPIRSVGTPWRFDLDLAGGGVLLDEGIYPVNTTRFLLGTAPTAVTGMGSFPDPANPAIEEDVAFQLAFPGDVLAVGMASYRGQFESHLRLVGTDGVVHVEDAFFSGASREITIRSADRTIELTGRPVDEVREVFDYFAHCIRTGSDPEPDGREGRTDLEIMTAIYRAIEDGQTVQL